MMMHVALWHDNESDDYRFNEVSLPDSHCINIP